MDKDQKKHLKSGFVRGWELVPNTARLCVMNLFLHGVDGDPCPIEAGVVLTDRRLAPYRSRAAVANREREGTGRRFGGW